MRQILLIILPVVLIAACDHGLQPPADAGIGSIQGSIIYIGEWPPETELNDLRFVAMRFVPTDTADFFRLNEMEISAGLVTNVESGVFAINSAQVGTYFYSGIAQQFEDNLFSWRPVGLYTANGGIFSVSRGETVTISIVVDFQDIPIFPPQ
jgi:hypothetical protein